jgi:NADPH2:quinone reductase
VLVYGDVPSPLLGPDQVRIEVALAGVNFGDLVLRSGRDFDRPRPYIPGTEVAGIVSEVGASVRELALGTRVAAPLFAAARLDGGYASEVVFDASRVVPLADDVRFETAVALQVQGISAWLLFEHVPVRGRSVLVHAAAGGAGSVLVQLAKHLGASHVIATASTSAKRAVARELGADVAIDYGDPMWPAHVLDATSGHGADLIIDSVGGVIRERSFDALATGGTLVLYGYTAEADRGPGESLAPAVLRTMLFKRQTITGWLWNDFGDPRLATRTMLRLFDLVRTGVLRVLEAETYPLARAADAHRALATRATIGKVFLAP